MSTHLMCLRWYESLYTIMWTHTYVSICVHLEVSALPGLSASSVTHNTKNEKNEKQNKSNPCLAGNLLIYLSIQCLDVYTNRAKCVYPDVLYDIPRIITAINHSFSVVQRG